MADLTGQSHRGIAYHGHCVRVCDHEGVAFWIPTDVVKSLFGVIEFEEERKEKREDFVKEESEV